MLSKPAFYFRTLPDKNLNQFTNYNRKLSILFEKAQSRLCRAISVVKRQKQKVPAVPDRHKFHVQEERNNTNWKEDFALQCHSTAHRHLFCNLYSGLSLSDVSVNVHIFIFYNWRCLISCLCHYKSIGLMEYIMYGINDEIVKNCRRVVSIIKMMKNGHIFDWKANV